MIKRTIIRRNINQIAALIQLQLKLHSRYKFGIFIAYITPIITIIMPLIVMAKIFEFNPNLGVWDNETFLVYVFIAYNLILLRGIIHRIPGYILNEKYWKTLTALVVNPFYRFNLLIALLITHLILVSIPFTFFFIVCYIIYPISIITILAILFLFLLITIIFSGIGLMIGVFAMAKENILHLLTFLINLSLWFSCLVYPFEIFPPFIQNIILLNPFYHIFDFMRYVWIEDDVLYSIISRPRTFAVLISSIIIIPCVSVIFFNKVYKKYGIAGY